MERPPTLSDAPVQLEYQPPTGGKRPFRLTTAWAFVFTAFEHAFFLLVYASTLDGGYLFKDCAIVAVTFWILILGMLALRRNGLSRGDRLFIAIGYPAMLIPCLIARGEFP